MRVFWKDFDEEKSGMELPWHEWSGHNNIRSSDLFDIFGQENEYMATKICQIV